MSGCLKQAAEVFPVARMQNCSLSLFDERNARLSLSYLPPRALGEKGQRLRAGWWRVSCFASLWFLRTSTPLLWSGSVTWLRTLKYATCKASEVEFLVAVCKAWLDCLKHALVLSTTGLWLLPYGAVRSQNGHGTHHRGEFQIPEPTAISCPFLLP